MVDLVKRGTYESYTCPMTVLFFAADITNGKNEKSEERSGKGAG